MRAEQRVINSVLKNGNVGTLFETNLDEMFVSFGDTWKFIKTYFNQHHIVPSFELVQEKFPDIQDLPINEHDAPAHFMEELKSEYLRGQLERLVSGASRDLNVHDPMTVIHKINTMTYEMTEKSGNSIKDLDIGDFDAAKEDFIKKREAFERNESKGVITGLDFWDSSLPNGICPGNMVVLAGYSGRMKSFLSALLAVRAFQQGKNVLVVSLEMSAEEYRDRIYTLMGEGTFSNKDMSTGHVDDGAFEVFAKDNTRSNKMVICAGVQQQVNPTWVAAKVKQYDSEFVILDYAQLMTDSNFSNSPIDSIKNLSRETKQLAMTANIAIVLISAVTAGSDANTDVPPRLQQLSYSKALIYDSDLGIITHLHRGSDRVEIICEKNRRGPEFGGVIEWDIDRGVVKESFIPGDF